MNRLNRICCTDYSGQRVQENFKTRFNKWLLIKRADVNERFVKKTSTFVHVCPQFGDWIILIGKSPALHTHAHTKRTFHFSSTAIPAQRRYTREPVSAAKCVKCWVSPLLSTWSNLMWVKFVARVSGRMLILAEVQTTDALYTNESIHFNNRSPIWHRGPSSTLYPGRGSHSCF